MKRALFVSYYFPPIASVGAFRPLKLAKYLPEFGWQTDILMADPQASTRLDASLTREIPPTSRVVTASTWETHPFFQRLDRTPLLKYWRLLLWPDSAVGWRPRALAAAKQLAQETSYDVIFSTAPPYSAHLLAMELSRQLNLPWVADYRDPWSQNQALHRTQPWRRSLDRLVERRVLNAASHVTAVTQTLGDDLRQEFALPLERLTILPNGFDPADFPPAPLPQNSELTLLFAGSAYGEYNPLPLLDGLNLVAASHPEVRFRVRLIGPISQWMQTHARNRRFAYPLDLVPPLAHAEIPAAMHAADMLILCCPPKLRVSLPSKLFEYMAAERPIFALTPQDSEIARLIREAGCGTVATSPDEVPEVFLTCYDAWRAGKPLMQPNASVIQRYSRRRQAEALAGIFDQLVETHAVAGGLAR